MRPFWTGPLILADWKRTLWAQMVTPKMPMKKRQPSGPPTRRKIHGSIVTVALPTDLAENG